MIKALQGTVLSLAIAASAILPSTVSADQITLTSVDQTVKLQGDFAGFKINAYIIVYNGHEIRVPAEFMHCEGNDCLEFEPIVEQIAPPLGQS